MVLSQVPSAGRASILKLQTFTVQKRQPFIRIVYGFLMVALGLVLVIVDPVERITNWMYEVREGSYVYNNWQDPPYQLYAEVWIYNYTNVPEYLSGQDSVLKLQEIGPFLYQEYRTNRNITVDRERGVMRLTPHIELEFLRNKSIADTKDVHIYIPNMALLAMSTLLADNLGYLGNAGAYYSISALGSKLFRNITVEEMLWGYEDPTVTIASNLLPGWIDFHKIGILDRFYAQKGESAEVEILDQSKKFSILSWDNSAGIVEQGFTDLNTSTLCNRAKGTYEGLMVPPHTKKETVIPIFRRQACRIFPFSFKEELNDKYGFSYYRFMMEQSAFNSTSPYACKCKSNCLPDGFVDVANCYYGFPITLSKPHFLDADPVQIANYEGLHPDPEKHVSEIDIEPILGVPLAISSKMQVNLAVRTNPGNPITKPFKDKMVPLLWLSLYCNEPPKSVQILLWLRLVFAAPFMIIVEVFLIIGGLIICLNGCYRCWKPKYVIIDSNDEKKVNMANEGLDVENFVFNEDDAPTKEVVSLLSIIEEDLVIRA